MKIIPAIDLREGRCVRLLEGRPDAVTVFSDDPVAMARQWQEQGAEQLHLVDLDGAFAGRPMNTEVIRKIIQAIDIPVEVGGGIRSLESAEMLLSAGAKEVIFGTVAVSQPELLAEACARFGEAVVVGIDSRDGMVAVDGWAAEARKKAVDLACEMQELGLGRIIYTDIRRDGTLKGPNIEATLEIARCSGLRVTASGGVSSLDDLRQLKAVETEGIDSVILGRAIYTGDIRLADALAIAKGK